MPLQVSLHLEKLGIRQAVFRPLPRCNAAAHHTALGTTPTVAEGSGNRALRGGEIPDWTTAEVDPPDNAESEVTPASEIAPSSRVGAVPIYDWYHGPITDADILSGEFPKYQALSPAASRSWDSGEDRASNLRNSPLSLDQVSEVRGPTDELSDTAQSLLACGLGNTVMVSRLGAT